MSGFHHLGERFLFLDVLVLVLLSSTTWPRPKLALEREEALMGIEHLRRHPYELVLGALLLSHAEQLTGLLNDVLNERADGCVDTFLVDAVVVEDLRSSIAKQRPASSRICIRRGTACRGRHRSASSRICGPRDSALRHVGV